MPQPARTIAIGDIHGCLAALDALLETIVPGPDDTVVVLGDYVDRGPQSGEVLQRLIELSDRCRLVPLLGNHEVMMLDAVVNGELDFWLTCGGFDTLRSYGGELSHVPARHVDFLRQCRRFWETDETIFVHANYRSDAPLAGQPDHVLLWEHLVFSVPDPHVSGKIAVVGHTPQPSGEMLDLGYLKCIDTYCVGGGWLTALDMDSGRLWQAEAGGRLRR